MIPIPEKRITDFENMGFGIYVHWGLYSQLGKGEWIQNIANIPRQEYMELTKTFTASGFSGRKLAKAAKRAGAKYITLTTRHHDGFSLYDTRGLNKYDAPHSICGRDLIADFVEGCNMEGIKPFFYHTTLDWYNDDFYNDFPAYLEYLRKSVEILCTNYGPIGGFEFDGNWSRKDVDWEEDKLYGLIRKYQPECIIINNTISKGNNTVRVPVLLYHREPRQGESAAFGDGESAAVSRWGEPFSSLIRFPR